MKNRWKRIFSAVSILIALCVFFLFPESIQTSHAAFGEDTERPRPEFSREGDRITAKYIPRAKSTSVLVHFTVSGGNLIEVRGMDFEKAERPEVDVKNFKSGLFTLDIGGVSPGGEAVVTLSSDFFTSSTQYYVFNERLPSPWMNTECENISLPNRVQDLVIKVKDGGSYDSDGKVNGLIFFVGGPRDSFWGYALGTLFIRFFGIFLVLSILMIGMMFSGRMFEKYEGQKSQKNHPPKSGAEPSSSTPEARESAEGDEEIKSESVAAAAAALHIHLSQSKVPEILELKSSESTGWVQHGRQRAMGAHPVKTPQGH